MEKYNKILGRYNSFFIFYTRENNIVLWRFCLINCRTLWNLSLYRYNRQPMLPPSFIFWKTAMFNIIHVNRKDTNNKHVIIHCDMNYEDRNCTKLIDLAPFNTSKYHVWKGIGHPSCKTTHSSIAHLRSCLTPNKQNILLTYHFKPIRGVFE